jgi:hypothetical protein
MKRFSVIRFQLYVVQELKLELGHRKPETENRKRSSERAARMIEQGKMTPRGQALIEITKETGRWE